MDDMTRTAFDIAGEVRQCIENMVDEMNLTGNVEIKRDFCNENDWDEVCIAVYALHPFHKIWGCEVNEFTGSDCVNWLVDDCRRALNTLNAWIEFWPDEIYSQAIAAYKTDDLWETIATLLLAIGMSDPDEIRCATKVIERLLSDLPYTSQMKRLKRMAYIYGVKLLIEEEH